MRKFLLFGCLGIFGITGFLVIALLLFVPSTERTPELVQTPVPEPQVVAEVAEADTDAVELEPDPTPVPESVPPSIGSRRAPARAGDVFMLEREDILAGRQKLEVELLEVVSGDQAWNIAREANQFNDAPKEGHEYILASFRFKVLETAQDEPFGLNHAMFDAVSADGTVYSEFLSISGLDPNLRTDLYEGAEHTGWTFFMVAEGDNALVAFDRRRQSEVWFQLRQGEGDPSG